MAFISDTSFFVSVSSLLVSMFRVLYTVLIRFVGEEGLKMKSSGYSVIPIDDSNNLVEKQSVNEEEEEQNSEISDVNGLEEEKSFGFTFKFPSYEEFSRTHTVMEKSDSNLMSEEEEESTSLILNKHEFQSPISNHVSAFVEEPEQSIFNIAELGQKETDESQSDFLSEKDFSEEKREFHEELELITSSDSDSDSDSLTSSHEYSFMSQDFLSDTDFEASIIIEPAKRIAEAKEASPSSSSSSPSSEPEDSNELESLWEHQELVDQLKMELKKVRATGLPTIMEDSESPKISSDLKPWKIDENFLRRRGDKLGELHKFYKSYRERMRKFDILNYQKMYALGFLQSKDPLHSFSSNGKSSKVPWGLKRKKARSNSDQMDSFVRELKGDLEMVYVGQLCLSWEFLQWQYEKAFEIWESDPHGFRRYNEVAGEFQQFQVLLHRFVENEPFQGPRVDNYVKNRCIVRNLLQVPVIKEDSKEGKKARRGSDFGAITSEILFDILEESIRTIWRFIRADKNASVVLRKCRRGHVVELQDPSDSDLLEQVRNELQKKDKKLKDLLRCGNCIIKKFQKSDENDGSDHVLFFAQVDLRLVARILNMARITTDQLVWCHSKLTKIKFVNRNIHVEPSFLLFPC